MNEAEYERISRLGSHYWWHVSRRRLVRRLFERFAAPHMHAETYLDVGCGAGPTLREFAPRFERAAGLDFSGAALGYAKPRVDCSLLQADAQAIPVPDGTADFVTCLDIVEHVRDDLAVIREVFRVCKPGGYAVFSVPALDFLWSEHDEAVHHLRRYSLPSLRAKMEHTGFEVVRVTYAVMALMPVVFLMRACAAFRRSGTEAAGHDFPRVPAWLNRLLIAWHGLEAAVSLRVPLPLGSGLVCIVRKPGIFGAEE